MSRSYYGGLGYLWYSFLYHCYGKVMINHDTSSHYGIMCNPYIGDQPKDICGGAGPSVQPDTA